MFLKMSQISQENTCIEISFNKVAGLQDFKKRLPKRFFPVKFVKYLRTHFFIELLRWLLLEANKDEWELIYFQKWHLQ